MENKTSSPTTNNMKIFRNILNNSSLRDIDKKNIEYIIEYFQGKHNPKLASRSFLFYGDPGLGKTHLAVQLLKTINKETLYMGCETFKEKNWTKYEDFNTLIKDADNNKKQIIFLDDLSYLLERDDGEIITIDQRSIMQILNLVKKNPYKLLIATLNDFTCLDSRMVDRIEVKIMFDLPSNENKKRYLRTVFREHLKESDIKYISKNTIGYNYRDLPEMIKLAYRLGYNNINKNSLKKAIQLYRPTELYNFNIVNGIDINFSDIIGKEKAVTVLKKVATAYKNSELSEKLGLRRSNLLLFHGPPGSGKSFTASALAGEIGFPLIRIHARHIYECGPFNAVETITNMARRFQNCVIFIDEAEKLLGNGRFEEDSPVLGEFHQCLDSGYGKEIQSILILAINDLSRFGNTLRDRFVHVPFSLPSFEERCTFFKYKIQQIRFNIKIELPCVYLARITENMSYRDMDRYWNELMFHYLEKKNVHPDDILSLAERCRGCSSVNEVMYS